MYEEKTRKSISINWKSLLIKMVILLAALFIVIWIVSLFNKKDSKGNESNIKENLQAMKVAAEEYFVGSRLPDKINTKKKITLGEMFDSKLLIEFKDQDNKECDSKLSYAEATKVDEESYTIKVKLVCSEQSDYIINTKKIENNSIDDNNDNNSNVDDNQNNDNNNSNDNNNNDSSNNTVTKPNKKPTVGVNTNKPSTSKPSTSTKPSTPTKPNNDNKPSTTCKYGNKEYNSYYPLAYIVAGNCAVNPNNIPSNDDNKVTDIAVKEYQKLVNEISALANKTNTRLFVAQPVFRKVYNTSGTGVVGYTVEFIARQYIGTYTSKVIYEYHLDQNGNRKVLIDNRSGINKNQGTLNNTTTNKVVKVNSISLNANDLDLYVDDTYSLKVTINPTNATNKNVKWTSNDNGVATVSSNGVITAKKEGYAIITATVDGKNAYVRVNVRKIVREYFELVRTKVTLENGETYSLDFDSNITNDARDISWSTSNSRVATVNSRGIITAKGSGKAIITGRINGITSEIMVNVLENSYLDILNDESVTVFVGEKHYIKVDTNIDNLKYQSSDTKIATVTYNGIVTAKKPGWVTITISGNGISKKVRIYCAETTFIYDSWVD